MEKGGHGRAGIYVGRAASIRVSGGAIRQNTVSAAEGVPSGRAAADRDGAQGVERAGSEWVVDERSLWSVDQGPGVALMRSRRFLDRLLCFFS